MFRRLAVLGLAFAAAILFASVRPARAATATNNLNVTATVIASCAIGSATLPFGNYDGMQRDVSTTVAVNCNANVDYWIGLDNGGPSYSAPYRRMDDGSGNYLEYQLARDAAQTANWDNNNPGTPDGSAPGNVTIYGRIPAGRVVPQGAYSDTVVMTLNF